MYVCPFTCMYICINMSKKLKKNKYEREYGAKKVLDGLEGKMKML